MRVLFVSSGNTINGEPGIIIKNQAESLIDEGISVEYFLIKGKGIPGYLKSIIPLRKKINTGNYQIVHAHYSFSGYVLSIATLFNSKVKKIVSLMGSDVQVFGLQKLFLRLFIRFFWHKTILKTRKMAETIKEKKIAIIPNGVNLSLFNHEVSSDEKTILFAANPKRYSKNFNLAKKAVDFLMKVNPELNLNVVYGIPHQDLIKEIYSCGCVLLTSRWEGSPNIIKEAMACNRPIVSTNVGDVSWLLDGLDGCFVVESNIESVANAILKAINFSAEFRETKGRLKLRSLELDSQSVAKKIIKLYSN
jgi:glycosyltransferase involved in cell wall biosynthesis